MRAKPSKGMLARMAIEGKDRLDFETRPPINILVKQTKEGKRKYKAVCKGCGDLLATFWSESETLVNAVDVIGYSWVNKKGWYGCRGININPVSSEMNFECSCGSAVIYEPNLNIKRYAEYKILLEKNG